MNRSTLLILYGRIKRVLGKEHLDAVHIDMINVLIRDDVWPFLEKARKEYEKDGENVQQ